MAKKKNRKPTTAGRQKDQVRQAPPKTDDEFDELDDFFFGSQTGQFQRDEFDYDPFEEKSGNFEAATEQPDGKATRMVMDVPKEVLAADAAAAKKARGETDKAATKTDPPARKSRAERRREADAKKKAEAEAKKKAAAEAKEKAAAAAKERSEAAAKKKADAAAKKQAEADARAEVQRQRDAWRPFTVARIADESTVIRSFYLEPADGLPLAPFDAGQFLTLRASVPGHGRPLIRTYTVSSAPGGSHYRISVKREEHGLLSRHLHDAVRPGDRLEVKAPRGGFSLDSGSVRPAVLIAGGVGITPMIAFAHRLHALGKDFELHYSASRKDGAGYLEDLPKMPWADKVQYHFSDQGTRADLDQVLAGWQHGWHVYTCGPDRYMEGVMEAAERQGFPEEARHLEYFSVPEQPEYENHPFTVKLARSGKELQVPEDKDLSDVLVENGVHVDVKCADGICGVCKCGLVSGAVEHRDFVLSNKQREGAIITCQSRAAEPDGVIELDL